MKSTRSLVAALTRVLLLAIAPIAEVATANAAATPAYKKLTLSKEFFSEGAAFADLGPKLDHLQNEIAQYLAIPV